MLMYSYLQALWTCVLSVVELHLGNVAARRSSAAALATVTLAQRTQQLCLEGGAQEEQLQRSTDRLCVPVCRTRTALHTLLADALLGSTSSTTSSSSCAASERSTTNPTLSQCTQLLRRSVAATAQHRCVELASETSSVLMANSL
jgi:hypothetical protein